MKLKFKLLLLALLSGFLLVSCTVDSPINTAKQFLSLWQKEQYDQAFNLVVNAYPTDQENKFELKTLSAEEKKKLIDKIKIDQGRVIKFNVQNAVPLKTEVLESLGVTEGYEVFLYLETGKGGGKNTKYNLLKIDNQWKILFPIEKE